MTESGSSWTSDDGYLFRVGPGGEAEIADEACRRFPNGLALAPDESRLYVVESRWPGVSSCPLRDGVLGEREETLPLPLTVPDGLRSTPAARSSSAAAVPIASTASRPRGRSSHLDDFTGEFLTTPTNSPSVAEPGLLGAAARVRVALERSREREGWARTHGRGPVE